MNSRLSGQLYRDDFLLSRSNCSRSVSQAKECNPSIPMQEGEELKWKAFQSILQGENDPHQLRSD